VTTIRAEFIYDCTPCFVHSCVSRPSRSTGKERDAESNLDYFGARHYSSTMARWMTPDPSGLTYANPGDPQSFNLYSYVANHPLTEVDLNGLSWWDTPCDSSRAADTATSLGTGLKNVFSHLFGCPGGPSSPDDSAPWGAGIPAQGGIARNPNFLVTSHFVDVAPSNPTCSVLVKCRGIEYKHLGLLGAEHCDARATDSSGVTHSLSGGPDGDPLNSTLNAWDTPNPTIQFTGWTVYNNPNSCTLAACVINSTNQYHNSPGHPQYNGVSGPNSNTWLKGTFSGCGATLPINTLGGIW